MVWYRDDDNEHGRIATIFHFPDLLFRLCSLLFFMEQKLKILVGSLCHSLPQGRADESESTGSRHTFASSGLVAILNFGHRSNVLFQIYAISGILKMEPKERVESMEHKPLSCMSGFRVLGYWQLFSHLQSMLKEAARSKVSKVSKRQDADTTFSNDHFENPPHVLILPTKHLFALQGGGSRCY